MATLEILSSRPEKNSKVAKVTHQKYYLTNQFILTSSE